MITDRRDARIEAMPMPMSAEARAAVALAAVTMDVALAAMRTLDDQQQPAPARGGNRVAGDITS